MSIGHRSAAEDSSAVVRSSCHEAIADSSTSTPTRSASPLVPPGLDLVVDELEAAVAIKCEPGIEEDDCAVSTSCGSRAARNKPCVVPKIDSKEATKKADVVSDGDVNLPECKIKRNYSCPKCDLYTQNPRDFLYHLRDVHGEKVRVYECPKCLYASRHLQKLLRHSRMVHGGRKRALEVTETTDIRNDEGREEEQEDDGDEEHVHIPPSLSFASSPPKPSSLKCSVCGWVARSTAQLTKHEREEHMRTRFFRCTKCSYVTHIKARFTKHVKYHSMPMIKCDQCDFRTPYKWNLDRHCKNHAGRGAFRCSACNFTADIKQSLTVHEMNHHVPPVGQAAGLGVGRRRNKVGASDSVALEQQEPTQPLQVAAVGDDAKVRAAQPPANKKSKSEGFGTSSFGSDFLDPDDIIHHANGKVYIKSKCKLCNYKSAWEGEMARHEKRMHGIDREESVPAKVAKKVPRPVPNLIPIPSQITLKTTTAKLGGPPILKAAEPPHQPSEPPMSQKDISEICAKSANSALKDFASLFGSEGLFKDVKESQPVPELIPTTIFSSTPKMGSNEDHSFKAKNASFFDKLKEKLLTSTGDIICKYCGHESKCLTEQAKHQKSCGKESSPVHIALPVHNISSSRCQYCRQRCKSSADLFNHLLTCPEAIKIQTKEEEEEEEDQDREGELKIDLEEDAESKPHPMENKVFVWNNIVVPMDIEVDDSNYEYTDERVDDNGSLDLSVRSHSPGISENSYVQEFTVPRQSPAAPAEKIPTHGNDISIAQHKRVFKCPHCTFWASTASRFHVHIVGHLNKKPFECSLCAYRSNWRWDITKHIKLKSVRDPAHEEAKVLMTDETGRRNYSKYNAYLTEIPVSGEHSQDTSGGSGTRHRGHLSGASPASHGSGEIRGALRPPPPLKAADFSKKRAGSESKRTQFKCKKCDFKDPSRETLLTHVKGHYSQAGNAAAPPPVPVIPQQQPAALLPLCLTAGSELPRFGHDEDEASLSPAAPGKGVQGPVHGQAPFRCGHCNQVSNWKHVIQRHCRLKHSGDIRVVSNKNGQERLEVEEHIEEPDHVDVPQTGTFKCNACPYSTDDHQAFEQHLPNHIAKPDSIMKCYYCKYFVSRQDDLLDHLPLHGVEDASEFLAKMLERNLSDADGKKFKCLTCPYVTNSKSQFTYHRQFHKPRGNQYNCSQCSYNVSKRHLLNQHLKVHGINVTSQKQNGDVIDLDDISDEVEEVASNQVDVQNLADIPLVWVSKNGKFSKMFKCRYCPHVNLRKVNIQEHEKMHSMRDKNGNNSASSSASTSKLSEIEHHCTECNYICNNAGVLSSHSKVHQGLYGTVHCLVDPAKSDEEQVRDLSLMFPNIQNEMHEDYETIEDHIDLDTQNEEQGDILYFCGECPARFLRENEYSTHMNLHSRRLFYKCDYCTYTSREKPLILGHSRVHSSEYQEETKMLKERYVCSYQPRTYPMSNNSGDLIWKVYDSSKPSDLDVDIENLTSIMNKPVKATQSIPLSGTELFQQKSDAERAAQQNIPTSPPPVVIQKSDPQFGTLMHGNPKFVYPTYLKNGKMKEKRYKCPKCPSAFEKREQYKVHLGLHGSKQRYQCEQCDYSVKYYANYVQHSKKHQISTDAQQTSKEGEEIEESIKVAEEDQQQSPMVVVEEQRKLFSCPDCPYANYRRDALDNHQKRHINISGTENNYTCQYCDYSVPQAHFLREHTKLHFARSKAGNPTVEGFMDCENLKLTAKREEDDGDDVIFEEQGAKVNDKSYLPPLSADLSERFNNNVGEKQLVNLNTGELVTCHSEEECKTE